jgi:hypothetical protein
MRQSYWLRKHLPAAHSANPNTRRSTATLAATPTTDVLLAEHGQNIVNHSLAHAGGCLEKSENYFIAAVQ